MIHRFASWSLTIALAVAALGMAACDDRAGGMFGPEEDQTALAFLADVAASGTAYVVVRVTGGGIQGETVDTIGVTDGIASGTVHVKPGRDRHFQATAFDGKDIPTHAGATSMAQVKGRGNPPLDFVLRPLVGGVPISMIISGFMVILEPASAELIAGTTLHVTTAVVEADGTPIPDTGDELIYGSRNPIVASIDGKGLITAHRAGATTIVVTWGATVGALPVTVIEADE